jgi:hypothetical protein
VYTRRLASFWALVSVPYFCFLLCGVYKKNELVCIDSRMAFRPLAIVSWVG